MLGMPTRMQIQEEVDDIGDSLASELKYALAKKDIFTVFWKTVAPILSFLRTKLLFCLILTLLLQGQTWCKCFVCMWI